MNDISNKDGRKHFAGSIYNEKGAYTHIVNHDVKLVVELPLKNLRMYSHISFDAFVSKGIDEVRNDTKKAYGIHGDPTGWRYVCVHDEINVEATWYNQEPKYSMTSCLGPVEPKVKPILAVGSEIKSVDLRSVMKIVGTTFHDGVDYYNFEYLYDALRERHHETTMGKTISTLSAYEGLRRPWFC